MAKKSPKPQKAKKNHIFSKPQPRVRTIKELLDVEDLSTLSWREQAKLARYTNRQAKKLMREYNMTAENWKTFITSESQPNAIDAFEKLMIISILLQSGSTNRREKLMVFEEDGRRHL